MIDCEFGIEPVLFSKSLFIFGYISALISEKSVLIFVRVN